MNYYQHHIGDFIRDTARLNDAQCMAYLRLIWMYYETEQPLESDVDALAFRIGANAQDVHLILRHFFFQHEGMFHHARCDKEILAFRDKSAKAKKSADARWNNANALRSQSGRNANEPVSDANQEPITNISTTGVVDKAPAKKPPSFDFLGALIGNGVAENIARDWMTVRKAKKAPNTETALAGFVREVRKAEITVEDAVLICIARNWQGFNASWDWRPKQQAQTAQRRMSPAELYYQQAYGKGPGNEPTSQQNELDITGECQRVS